jgi:flavin reductase (DIM6/NTAB) family NADH-FMN oxidoreductase RutF
MGDVLSSFSKADSSAEFLGFDVSTMQKGEAYRLLIHCVAPRPIAFVSTLSKSGQANLAPFSFFMGGGANPPSVAFAPNIEKEGRPKDTLVNIRETGEYTINVVSHNILTEMNQASYSYEHGVSEWQKTGLSQAPAAIVKPCRVAESLMAMECRLFEIVQHGEGIGAANYVIGEVVYFHVNKAIIKEGRIDPTLVDYVGRMGGQWYTRALPEAMFQLARPDKG